MIPRKLLPLVAAATVAILFEEVSLSGTEAAAAVVGEAASTCAGMPLRQVEGDSARTHQEGRSYVPLVMFGVFGALLGAWIGGHMAPAGPDDGKLPSRLLPEEAESGAFIGLVVGAALGYYLGTPRDSVSQAGARPSSAMQGRTEPNEQKGQL